MLDYDGWLIIDRVFSVFVRLVSFYIMEIIKMQGETASMVFNRDP